MIGIDDYDGPFGGIVNFAQFTGVTYPLLMDGSAVENEYGTYHQSIIVDQEGIVRMVTSVHDIPFDAIQDTIDTYLAFTSVKDSPPVSTPDNYMIVDAFPNPFNPVTNISISLAEARYIRAEIYSGTGRLVDLLMDSKMPQGTSTLQWRTNAPSGVYFLRVTSPEVNTSRTMRLVYLK